MYQPKIVGADTLPVLMHWLIFGFYANFSFTAVYGFTAVHDFKAITCNLMVTFEEAHWVKLIQPQRWAGVAACPPWR